MRIFLSTVIFFTSLVLGPVFSQFAEGPIDIVPVTFSPCDSPYVRTHGLFELLCKGSTMRPTLATIDEPGREESGRNGDWKLLVNKTIEDRPFWYDKDTKEDNNHHSDKENEKSEGGNARNQTEDDPVMPEVAARAAYSVAIPEPQATILPLSRCRNSEDFAPCDYFTSCFGKKLQECGRRASFIGDDAQRLCVFLNRVAGSRSTASTYRNYIYDTFKCVAKNLKEIVEFPTCDDISFTLESSIFSSNTSSCLYQANFCRLMKDRMFVEAIGSAFEPENSDLALVERLVPAYFELIENQCDDHSRSNFATYVIGKLTNITNGAIS